MSRLSIWSGLAAVLSGLAAVLVAAAACTGGGSGEPAGPLDCAPAPAGPVAMAVKPRVALADEQVHIQVSGLDPGQGVTVRARAADGQGEVWQAHATFAADAGGVVDLDRDAPGSGSYDGVDGMGLFWSMEPPDRDPERAWFLREDSTPFEVELVACVDGNEAARTTLTRQWLRDGVSQTSLRPAAGGVYGELFLPPEGEPRRSGVLLIGGSNGGVARPSAAALLASRGHPALALAYFGPPGMREVLQNIPLEYFAEAAGVVASHAGDSAVAVVGHSRGGEAALLLAQHFPEVVHGVVGYAGSNRVQGAYPSTGAAWTLDGAPMPRAAIPLDNLPGPVLAIAGGDDASFWPADTFAELIMEECRSVQSSHDCDALIYPDAGHFIAWFPFAASGTVTVDARGEVTDWGGSRAANEAARQDGWPRVLAFLAGLGDSPA